jgi:HD superfamily phosphodiesterase
MDFGCASYCKFAEQCLGDLPPELMAKRDDLLKDRVAIEMKKYFHKDFKRIAHATKVARYAEQIVKQEGGDPAIVLPAGYLHDIGIKEAERKYQSSAAHYQEQEGPPVARDILTRLGARQELIDEVCDIIGHHHHPRDEETLNFKILYDADLIVNLEENHKDQPIDREKLQKIMEKSFFTETGKQLAAKVLLEANE